MPAPVATLLREQSGLLHSPSRLAIGPDDSLYILEPSGRVVVRDALGMLVSLHEQLGEPTAIAVGPSGTLYIADRKNGSVSIFDSNWNLLGKLGNGDGEFLQPTDIAIDPDPQQGYVFVTDGIADAVKVYSPAGSYLFSFGSTGTALGSFKFPSAIFVSAVGEVYVGDQSNDRVQVFDRQGTLRRCFGSRNTSFSRRFGRIQAITGDASGRVYVADSFQGRVQSFDAQGVLLSTVASFGDAPGQLRTPYGLAVDSFGRLFVSSLNGGRLDVLGLDGYADPHGLTARVEAQPRQLARGSRRLVAVRLELAEGDISSLDLGSVRVNGVPPAARAAPIEDGDGDGLPEMTLRFRADQLLSGLADGAATLLVTGFLNDGTPVEGVDVIEVLPKI